MTGVRFARLPRNLTADPVDPVKSRWSNGSAGKRRADLRAARHDGNSSAEKARATALQQRRVRGVCSDGLIITRLPAASAGHGPSESCTG